MLTIARWGARQLVSLATLVTAAVLILLLPTLIGVNRGCTIDIFQYWRSVSSHLLHLIQGHLIPPEAALTPWRPINAVPAQLLQALPITLKLLGSAFGLSLLLGLSLGVLLSLLAPRWLRSPLWGATTLLYSLADLLIASLLQLALVIVAMLRGGAGPLRLTDSWHYFWAPVIALTLVVLPYLARVTATAIDEISGQQYIRAAVARGIHPVRLLLKHVGKNVLIRISTVLPVVAGLLCSSEAVVEYIMNIYGVGRALLFSAGPRTDDRFAGVLFLLPLLILFTLLLALSELLQRWLDPRTDSAVSLAVPERTANGPSRWQILLRRLGAWLRSLPETLRDDLPALRARLRKALRDPVLLIGLLLVLGLIAVAAAAPWLAPHDPFRRIPAITTPDGRIQVPPFAPSPEHLLGTDDLGRDLFSQILYGTRYALLFALLAAPARFLIAIPLGLLAAFRGGRWERLIRSLATFFTAVPQVLLPLALIPSTNLLFREMAGPRLTFAVLLVALPGAPRLAASARSQAVEVLEQPFVEGAYAVGASTARTLFRYVLPQMLPQLATMLALEIPAVLTLTALLGYFGAYPGGAIYDTQTWRPIGPLVPEWGSLMESPLMLLLAGRWWIWAPVAAIFVTVLAFNLFGEGIRRVLGTRTGWKWQ